MLRSQLRPGPRARATAALLAEPSDPQLIADNGGLARAIARLINAQPPGPWPPPLSSALAPLLRRLTEPALLRALDLLRPPASALRLFNHALLRLRLNLSSHAFSKMLLVLSRSRDLFPAHQFLLSLPHPPPDQVVNSLLRAHSRNGNLRAAQDLFRSIPSPSVFSYNSLLSALLRRGRTQAAAKLYSDMAASAVAPDVCTFNTLIRGFCLNSMVDDAFRYFQEMARRGCAPDVITYNTLLDGLCRAGRVDTARNLLNGMATKGPELAPNVVSYTTLIRGYCGKLRAAEAVRVLDEMVDNGIEPNKITYNTLIQGLCEAKRMDLVKGILERAGKTGFRPDTCTFNTLIASHCDAGCVDDALKVYDIMPELKVKRDSATYSTLIRGLCNVGEFQKVEELVDELLEKRVLGRRGVCVPLMAAYNPVFEYFCGSGKAEKAGKLFRQLLERRASVVDVVTFKILILGHCKEEKVKQAYELLVTMVRRELVPDAETYQALIQGFLSKVKMRFAWMALGKMLSSGHRPSTHTFQSVLAGLVKKEGYAKEAGQLVAVMLERKVRQNIDLSTDVVDSLFRSNLHDRAFEIIRLLYDSGYCVQIEKVVGSLCEGQKFLEAQEILVFCLEKRQNLDAESYGMVIKGLCSTGRAIEAFRLFYDMIEKGSASAVFSHLNELKHALEAQGKLKEAKFVSKQIAHANNQLAVRNG